MIIDGRRVEKGERPYIIAEMSGNHNHSLERALRIVEEAARSGADAIKLQTYTADTMTLDIDLPDFRIEDPNSLWDGRLLYELYDEAHTPWEWHSPLMERAAELGIACFSSPFDRTAIDFLESLGAPAYKIASFEIVDIPLIEAAAATGKPLIISTGMSTVEEIGGAVEAARSAGCEELALLKCTSTYPTSPADSNVLTIPDMRERFGCEVGLSDHTLGIGASLAAVAHGASIIERHFTLDRSDGGVDSAFSLEPAEMTMLREESERVWLSLGEPSYGGSDAEEGSRRFRRSLYICADLEAGDILSEENIRSIRPGYGLPPRHYREVLGMRICGPARRGTPLSWELIERP